MDNQELMESVISAATAIVADAEFSKPTLKVAQALRRALVSGGDPSFFQRRGSALIDAAISFRLGCPSVITVPGLYWEAPEEQQAGH